MSDAPESEEELDPDRLFFSPEEVNAAIIKYRKEMRDSPKEAKRQLRAATLENQWHISHDFEWLPDLSDEEIVRRSLGVDEVDDDLERTRLLRELRSRGFHTDSMDMGRSPVLRRKLEEDDLGFFKRDD